MVPDLTERPYLPPLKNFGNGIKRTFILCPKQKMQRDQHFFAAARNIALQTKSPA